MSEVIRGFNKHKFLSNFYPSTTIYEGRRYATVEHAFQAAKSLDDNDRMLISISPTPGEAKKFGKRVKLRPDWENVKVKIMKDFLKQKFQNEDLKKKLLETGDAVIIEENHHGDKIWGQVNGEGENLLGKLLMEVREELKK